MSLSVPWRIVLALLMPIIFGTTAFAAVIGDPVELKATNQAGVPVHQEPRGTNGFQRVPVGTRATVLEVAQDGRWLKLSLPSGRTGWVTSRDVSQPATGTPSPGISATTKKPQRIEEGIVERVADGDTVTVITPHQTKLRTRLFGIDASETPKGTKFPGQPSGPAAKASLKRLVEGTRVMVEIDGGNRYTRLLSTIYIDGEDMNLTMLEAGLAEIYRSPESGNPYKPQDQAAEEAARFAKKGMWVLGDSCESLHASRKRVGIG